MHALRRKLRSNRDGRDYLPTRDDFQPIDTQEQEELVRSFETKHKQQSALWRSVFSVLLLCFTAFLIFSIFQQVYWPWELRYHAYFMDEVEPLNLISAEVIAVIVCLMATRGFVHNDSAARRQYMWCSCCIGFLLAIFWLNHMWRMPKFPWDAIWLPLGPVGGAGICLYVDHVLADSLREIQKLRACIYSYKAS